MTTELEKQFFDTFGIEPETGVGLVEFKQPRYPQITDRHYLELICVHNKELIKRFEINCKDLKNIKNFILSECIKNYTFYSNSSYELYNRFAKSLKHQVQAIFEEER